MKANTNAECYGRLFPNMLANRGETVSGHVFTRRFEPTHGFMPARQTVEIDQDAWEACMNCPRFQDCY